MNKMNIHAAFLIASIIAFAGCKSEPRTPESHAQMTTDADAALKDMKVADPSLEGFLAHSSGFVIFPSVGKGGLIAGGAYGRGRVYEQGVVVGDAELTQATIGLQAGGQTYSELIVFEDPATMQRFKQGKFAFSANASAVAIKEGVASTAGYTEGVAVFTRPLGGLMFEASVGGQKFKYEPLGQSPTTMPSTAPSASVGQ